MNVVDDLYIGNVLNSYHISRNEDYKKYIKSFTHAWYKCVPGEFDCGHKLSNFGKCGDAEYYKDFITIQVKRYREREFEEKHYYERHDIMRSEDSQVNIPNGTGGCDDGASIRSISNLCKSTSPIDIFR